MAETDLTLIPEIPVSLLRDQLAECLERVRRSGQPMLILRRGQPLAGLVSAEGARALWTVTQEREHYREWRMLQRLDQERDLRMALMREAEQERRRAYEARLLGR